MSHLDGSTVDPATTPEHFLREREAMELMDTLGTYGQALDDLLNAAIGNATERRSTHISLLRLADLVYALKIAKGITP